MSMTMRQLLEMNRRDFIKSLVGTAASAVGSKIPGVDAVSKAAKPVATVTGALKKFKVVGMGYYRGELELGGDCGFGDIMASSVEDAVKQVVQSHKESYKEDALEYQNARDWEDASKFTDDDNWGAPEDEWEDWIPGAEFFHVGNVSEKQGVGSGSIGEEEGFFVISEENPLYNTINKLLKDGNGSIVGDQATEIEDALESWNQEFYDSPEYKQSEEYKNTQENEARGQRAQNVVITLPRHVAKALYNALNKYL